MDSLSLPREAFADSAKAHKAKMQRDPESCKDEIFYDHFSCSTIAVLVMHLRWQRELKKPHQKTEAVASLTEFVDHGLRGIKTGWPVTASDVEPADCWPSGVGDIVVPMVGSKMMIEPLLDFNQRLKLEFKRTAHDYDHCDLEAIKMRC